MNPAAMGGARIAAKADQAGSAENTRARKGQQGCPVVFDGPEGPCRVTLKGRVRWALCQLVEAGARGVTPVERPAPRWSSYVHDLRRLGFAIETIRERHGGDFPGQHARYVLQSAVAIGGGSDG